MKDPVVALKFRNGFTDRSVVPPLEVPASIEKLLQECARVLEGAIGTLLAQGVPQDAISLVRPEGDRWAGQGTLASTFAEVRLGGRTVYRVEYRVDLLSWSVIGEPINQTIDGEGC